MASVVAHVVSVVMFVLGVSYVVQAREWIRVSQEVIASPHRFLMPALVMLAAGVAIVSVHNDWVPAWTLAITLSGWILVVKGTVFLVLPHMATKFAHWPEGLLVAWIRVAGVVLAVVGAVLTYQVWITRFA
ncbi:MAG: hypothetical protein LJE97_15355 [Betaproteobacteria bacterium]|jgi:uncharacterized protein YjeT (DUF2065 family)|nr:hypothetical protein [Betaproteobacteria bacterium]